MARKPKTRRSGRHADSAGGCCRVASLVTIDDRGQMVLPKSVRERTGLRAGDKLALITWEPQGRVQALVLVKADELTSMVSTLLGPAFAPMAQEE